VQARALQSRRGSRRGAALTTDGRAVFASRSAIELVGGGMTRAATQQVYSRERTGPRRTSTSIELHDCFSPNELITYEALDLASQGSPAPLVSRGRDDVRRMGSSTRAGADQQGHPLGGYDWRNAGRADLAASRRGWRASGSRRRRPANTTSGLGGACVVTIVLRTRGTGVSQAAQPRSALRRTLPASSA